MNCSRVRGIFRKIVPLASLPSARRSDPPRWMALLSGIAALAGFYALPAASAVSPPLGPVATVEKPDSPSFGIGTLRLLVRGFAQKTVDDSNVSLQTQGKSTRVTLGDVLARSPYRTATQFVDRPNQYIVRAPFSIRIDVHIPWSFDRVIYLPIDIDVSCEGWHRSAGEVRFVAVPGPASIEGGNILEEIIGVRDLISAKVRSGFTPPSQSQLPFSGACATIGVSNGGGGAVDFASIIWSKPLRLAIHVLQQRIEVRPLTLRRLAARTYTGTMIGNIIENVSLQSFANFHVVESSPVAMRENDLITLTLPAMVLNGEPTTALVVIGNVRDSLLRTAATAFDFSTQSANYSPGTHTLKILADYWMPPTPPLRKPIKISVPAYELSYHVSYVPPLAGNLAVASTGTISTGTIATGTRNTGTLSVGVFAR
jgi:hypothetical protein